MHNKLSGRWLEFSCACAFGKKVGLLVVSIDSLCDTNIPLFKPTAFFQSLNPNPVKTSFLKAKQLMQNSASLWFE
jgi:hypothetical protein